jgi:acetoin utilization deacetylase AcuC-like enzyme
MGPMHPESRERIGAIHDMLLIKGLIDCMQPDDVPLATESQLAQAHSALYMAASKAKCNTYLV